MTKPRLAFIAAIAILTVMLWQRPPTVEARAPGVVSMFYSPETDPQKIDDETIGRGEHTIDMAVYILTSWPVMQALSRAADRGVHVRLVVDFSELPRDRSRAFTLLARVSKLGSRAASNCSI